MFRAFLAMAAVGTILAGCAGDVRESVPDAPRESRPLASGMRMLGLLWEETGINNGELARLNALTLKPSGPRVALARGGASSTAFSADRKTLAIGNGEEASIQLVDVERMRTLGVIPLGLEGWVTMLSWQSGYLFAVVNGQYDPAVAVVDPVGKRVLRRHRLGGIVIDARPGPGTVVVLTGPAQKIGPITLSVVGGKGMDSVLIRDIVGGFETDQDGEDIRTREATPGLAVDPVGRRAVIAPAGRTVAEVSLSDLSVEYHTLAEHVSLLNRLRNWLEPQVYAKTIDGPVRRAIWIGDGLLAVSGADYSTVANDEGELRIDATPAGVSLIDTRDWSIRTIDENATEVMMHESTLLAFGVAYYDDASSEGFGLVGYDLGGDERFRLFEGVGVGWVQVAGGYVYATWEDKRFAVIDPASGEIVARAATERPTSLVQD